MQVNQKKIINDPVYGFITIPSKTILDIIELPYFQRLRRIKQLGLTHYVYPGALHTRFHHAIGAMHLMDQAVEVLRSKGNQITDEEKEGALIAILMHDIGHGPFSHALERMFIAIDHEDITIMIMEKINSEWNGKLDLAIQIFKGTYSKRFLNELVSSQLDVDRMDYLTRDSFYTGVAEGVIGYDRILKMMDVYDGHIVLEEKGLYSIEKFLLSRRLMYWQVYLHKTVIAAEKMLLRFIQQVRKKYEVLEVELLSPAIRFFLSQDESIRITEKNQTKVIDNFLAIDDIDIENIFKVFSVSSDFLIRHLSTGLLHRRLFHCSLQNEPFSENLMQKISEKLMNDWKISKEDADDLIITGTEKLESYSNKNYIIKIINKRNEVISLDSILKHIGDFNINEKFFLTCPKLAYISQESPLEIK